MKVEYQDNFSADGHKVDLYIPEKYITLSCD